MARARRRRRFRKRVSRAHGRMVKRIREAMKSFASAFSSKSSSSNTTSSKMQIVKDGSMLASSSKKSKYAPKMHSKDANFVPLLSMDGAKLKWGDVMIMADFFGVKDKPISSGTTLADREKRFHAAFDKMAQAPKKRVEQVLGTAEHYARAFDKRYSLGKRSARDIFRQLGVRYHLRFNKIMGGAGGKKDGVLGMEMEPAEYQSLDERDHYGENARRAYMAGHLAAMRVAAKAGALTRFGCRKSCTDSLMRAYAMDAFASHYLANAFASGHIRVPRGVFYDACPKVDPNAQATFVTPGSTEELATTSSSSSASNASFTPKSSKDAIAEARKTLTKAMDKLSAIFEKASAESKEKTAKANKTYKSAAKVFKTMNGRICDAAASLMHAQDNARGLWVSSPKHPTPWKAYGDRRFWKKNNRANQKRVVEAVQASANEIAEAFRTGKVALASEMSAYFPRAIHPGNANYPNHKPLFKSGPAGSLLWFVPTISQ